MRRTRLKRALAVSVALHALALLLLFAYAPSPLPDIPPPAAMEIVSAEDLGYVPAPSARHDEKRNLEGSDPASFGVHTENRNLEGSDPSVSKAPEGSAAVSFRIAGEDERREVFEREVPLVPWAGAPGTPGGPEHPDEALDGIGKLGTGNPGDPRIPGFGGTDLGMLIARDSRVAQAKERAERGQIHPYLADAKARMESCWKPDRADGRAARGTPTAIEDPVCAQGYHLRYRVAKVLVIYDSAGSRISLRMIGAPDARQLEQRVTRAIDEARLEVRPPPPELLDERGLLRLAWNVYVDDYTGCNLMGEGTSGKYDGAYYVVGVIELEGVF